MKFSISWISKHLTIDWRTIDVHHVVKAFNHNVAEIEQVKKIERHLDTFTVAQVLAVLDAVVTLFSPEWEGRYELPMRDGVSVGQWYMIIKTGAGVRWALVHDLGSDKEGALPALSVTEDDQRGGWKGRIATHDYIFEVDNKSITHRPDLWGHRGMAREIGALIGSLLKPLEDFLSVIPVERAQTEGVVASDIPFTVRLKPETPCQSLAAIRCDEIEQRPSSIDMAFALCSVDGRPVSALVDITNYVMLDIGSPMHAFDAITFEFNVLEVRLAHNGESLTLLDGETVSLTQQDIVITNGLKPVSLAGVMGGKDSGVTLTTSSVVLEAGCFEAGTIRRTAARLKKRTDASARFEKSLDADMPVLAIRRFLALMHEQGLRVQCAPYLLALGRKAHTNTIELSHTIIQEKLGLSISPERVCALLRPLEFVITYEQRDHDLYYTIVVPPFRATKDITIAEDIIEEIARSYGYHAIAPTMPTKMLKAWDMKPLMRIRQCKQVLAYGLQMQEVYNYALYDENFLKQLAFEPTHTIEVQSPVSEHWRRLVTSLIPHLIKNVVTNMLHHDQLRFFEWGRVWSLSGQQLQERRMLAAIVVDQKNAISFYDAKQEVMRLCGMLGLKVEWIRIDDVQEPWYMPYESAYIMHNGHRIGRMGKLDSVLLHRVIQGDGYCVEFDGEYLLNLDTGLSKFKPISKYPEITRDVSMFVPAILTVAQLQRLIQEQDPRIVTVDLLDFFDTNDGSDRRALTMRFVIRDETKTLTKDEADAVTSGVIDSLKNVGAQIR